MARILSEVIQPPPFYHPAAANVWIDVHKGIRDIQPRFLIGSNGQCQAFVPLVLWRRSWKQAAQRVLLPVGHDDFDYNEPLVIAGGEAFDWSNFWSAMLSECRKTYGHEYDRIELKGVRGIYVAGHSFFTEKEECPLLDLSRLSDAGECMRTLSGGERRELERRKRNLQAIGEVSHHVYDAAEDHQAAGALIKMLDAHRRRWPKAYKADGFHRKLLLQLMPAGLLHFSELRLANKAISWRFAFKDRQTFYSYMPAFDVEWMQYSPGTLHLLENIKWAIQHKYATFDFLRGREKYKDSWSSGVISLFSGQEAGSRSLNRARTAAAGLFTKLSMLRLKLTDRKRPLGETRGTRLLGI